MLVLALIVLIVLLFILGFSFSIQILWWLAIAALVLFVLGFFFRGAESGGWYGRRRW